MFDPATGLVFNYYYQRGAKKLKRRITEASFIFDNPMSWPDPEVLAEGNEARHYDAGNVNAAVSGGRHVLATYTGSPNNASVFVVSVTGTVPADGSVSTSSGTPLPPSGAARSVKSIK